MVWPNTTEARQHKAGLRGKLRCIDLSDHAGVDALE